MNDQTAQMGFQIGKSAVMAGQEYVDQNVGAVSNRGVLMRSTTLDEGADSVPGHRSTATSLYQL